MLAKNEADCHSSCYLRRSSRLLFFETGAELAKGDLPGDIYTATKELHNSIGDMMQKMAKGAGSEANKMFWDSRKFYSGYMDTFHEPAGPSSSGSPVAQALLAKDPVVAADIFSGKSGDRGIADLRRYSDSLANLAQDIRQRAQTDIKVPARKSVMDLGRYTPEPHQTISAGDITAAKKAAAEAAQESGGTEDVGRRPPRLFGPCVGFLAGISRPFLPRASNRRHPGCFSCRRFSFSYSPMIEF